jgi:hypothetical protein
MDTRKFFIGRAIGFIIVLLFVAAAAFLGRGPKETTVTETPKDTTTKKPAAISISSQDIKEENFSGSKPIIKGTSPLAAAANVYIDDAISQFKTSADEDVPDMRAKFGADSPTANYTIDMEATQAEGEKTKSIIISTYAYTGGANGNSLYKVFTARNSDGQILALSDIISADKKASFVSLVQKKLNAWRPEGSEGTVVFPDEVKNLSFNFFTNFSLDKENLTLYFDKYDIGPGALGPVAFPIKLSELQSFLKNF